MNKFDPLSSDSIARRTATETAQTRLEAIVESLDDGLIGLDLDGNITDWNRGAEKIFGYTAKEMVGSSLTRIIPSDHREEEDFISEKIRRGEKVEHFETVRQTREGRLINVSISASPLKDGEGNIIGVLKIARDITSQKDHHREHLRVIGLYAALSHINRSIVWTTKRDELFQQVCNILVEHAGFHMAWTGWHDQETLRIVPVAIAGKEQDYLRTVTIYSDDRPEGCGPSGQAFRTGKPYICSDMHHNPITLPWRSQLAQRGFQSSAGFPIRLKNEVCAVLTVYSADPWFFQDKEIELLDISAGDISLALDNFANHEARRQIEKIAESERLFSATMIESTPGILYFYDDQGHFLRWNRNFEMVSGYSTEEIARMHPLDFFLADEQESLKERIAEVFEQGESFVEANFVAKNGRAIPYFFTGRRILFNGKNCLVGMGVDISERKQTELHLRETQGQLEAVVENLREGLVIADPAGGFLRWNPASLRMLGFADLEEGRRRQREFAGIFELFTLDGVQLPPDQWPLGRVRRGEPIDNLEIRVRRPGSNWERIFSYAGTLVRYTGEKTLAFMTIRDITERVQAEQSLRVLNQTLELEVAARTGDLQAALVRAEASDRLKSAFLATMSHELRTPLNSIIGFTGIVLQGLAGPLNAEQSKQLGMVRTSSRHLLELINDVLDLSKIEAGQLEVRFAPFNLPDLIASVVALVKPLAEKKGLELAVVTSPEVGAIISDRRRVEQILINLINNAIKFTPQGRVNVTAGIVIGYPLPGGAVLPSAVQLRIADTGIGIKPEDLPTLFQPFHQLDAGLSRQHEGTGLGLAICRRLASLLGGDISVASEWGKGSEFTIAIPNAAANTS